MPLVNDNSTSQPPNGLLHIYMGFTLVDVTKTGITDLKSSEQNPKGRNQQRNWESLVQSLSLRAQLIVLEAPELIVDNVEYYQFGDKFKGKHNIWTFKFGTEHDGVYGEDFRSLKFDFNLVPIISNLDETICLQPPVFSSFSDDCNVYFTNIKA